MFTCENCHQPFKAQSSLLRHISHKERCKDHYGKERLDDVKKASNLILKRKWKKAHSAELKSKQSKYRKELAKAPTKRYIKSDVGKSTPEGKSFTVFYENVYYEAISKIEEEKWQDLAYDAVYNFAWGSAVDFTMTSDDYVKIFEANINYFVDEGIREDVDIGLELEKAFDTSFDRLLKSEINKSMDNWVSARRFDIYQKCWHQGERRVFSNFFEEFKNDLYVTLSSKAIDLAFSELDGNIEYSDIEWDLDRTFKVQLKQLVEESSENSNLSRIVFKTVYDMMYRQAVMWIKLNKPFTD